MSLRLETGAANDANSAWRMLSDRKGIKTSGERYKAQPSPVSHLEMQMIKL